MKIIVHHFKIYDPASDSWIVPQRKSSSERIQDIRGIIIPGTSEEVDRADLDEHGRYDPRSREDVRPRILN